MKSVLFSNYDPNKQTSLSCLKKSDTPASLDEKTLPRVLFYQEKTPDWIFCVVSQHYQICHLGTPV